MLLPKATDRQGTVSDGVLRKGVSARAQFGESAQSNFFLTGLNRTIVRCRQGLGAQMAVQSGVTIGIDEVPETRLRLLSENRANRGIRAK
jgi:hypothetical protein